MAEVTSRADLLDDLTTAHEAYERRREAVAEVGETSLEALATAHDRATSLLDRYEGSATGTGDFEAYIEFRDAFGEHVEALPEDLPRREAFERAEETLDKRRLSERDFERAREALADAGELADRLDARREARERYRSVRRAIESRIGQLDERIAELERTAELGRADLDAPIETLREPIAAYNAAVRDAFDAYLRETSAREVLAFVATTTAYPLVPFDRPPEDLAVYVREASAGAEPIPRLLEYSEYSISKLGHYVDAPRELKRYIATHRTYLRNLDADPLVVDWPPPPADRLRWRCRELIAVVGRFAPEPAVERLRAVRASTRDPEYERLRDAAHAHATLDPDVKERLANGRVERDLEAAREERDRLAAALSEHPTVG